MTTKSKNSTSKCGGIAWWGWLLGAAVGSIAAIILITWWQEAQHAARLDSQAFPPPLPPEPEPTSPVADQPVAEADKLTLIKGIGPKTANMLNSRGITTFEQLANTEVSYLQTLLAEWDWHFIDPTPWPEQARQLMQAKK